MAKFRDSSVALDDVSGPPVAPTTAPLRADDAIRDRSIGDILTELRNLSAEQVEQVLRYQRERDVRFGEATVALGLASRDDVLFALAQQFHYPYSPQDEHTVNDELVVLREPFSARAESFRAIRSQVIMRLFSGTEPRRAVAVVSPDAGDGKTYCAANLAATLAQVSGRTLLVDADLRNPRQHELFGISNRNGLSGILSGRSDEQVIQQVVGVPSLFVLPVGTTPPNPLELVERPAFGLLMRELVSKFDHIVVDTPAVSLGADASVIVARCGAALLLARKNSSRIANLQEIAATLTQGSAKIAGVIINEF